MTLLNLQDEKEERELRKVEMQTQKAENMIEHDAEIYARPPRTWFQTEKQKKESAKRGRVGADEEGGSQAKASKKQKREDGKGKKEKQTKQDRAKQKHGDALLEVSHQSNPSCLTDYISRCCSNTQHLNSRVIRRVKQV